ncbi:hypothetical protein P7C70_g5891, partial [Phenoliferia sp. Uapishka_3]
MAPQKRSQNAIFAEAQTYAANEREKRARLEPQEGLTTPSPASSAQLYNKDVLEYFSKSSHEEDLREMAKYEAREKAREKREEARVAALVGESGSDGDSSEDEDEAGWSGGGYMFGFGEPMYPKTKKTIYGTVRYRNASGDAGGLSA